MVPFGEADYLVVLERTQVEVMRGTLRPAGIMITPDDVSEIDLNSRRATTWHCWACSAGIFRLRRRPGARRCARICRRSVGGNLAAFQVEGR